MTHIICIKRKVIHSKIVEKGETGVDSPEAKENLERVE